MFLLFHHAGVHPTGIIPDFEYLYYAKMLASMSHITPFIWLTMLTVRHWRWKNKTKNSSCRAVNFLVKKYHTTNLWIDSDHISIFSQLICQFVRTSLFIFYIFKFTKITFCINRRALFIWECWLIVSYTMLPHWVTTQYL